MSNSSTTQIVSFPKIKFVLSGIALILCLLVSFQITPMFIMAVFFGYQTILLYVVYDVIETESRFLESFWVAPAQLGVATAMIASGIPKENSFWGLIWIGMAVLFMLAGIRNLYLALKSFSGGGSTVPADLNALSAKQLKKSEKQEEALMADIEAYLGDSDTTGEGRTDV